MTNSLARKWRRYGVTVNASALYLTGSSCHKNPEVSGDGERLTALGDIGEPEGRRSYTLSVPST